MTSVIGVVSDTTSDVATMVIERWRVMSPGEKLDQVAELNRACDRLSEAGVRSRYPGVGDDEVRRRSLALRLGRELMVEVYGWDPGREGW